MKLTKKQEKALELGRIIFQTFIEKNKCMNDMGMRNAE